MSKKIFGLLLGLLSAFYISAGINASSAFGAERIVLFYTPFEFYINLSGLIMYADEGKITDDFRFYLGRIDPEEVWLRDFLQTRYYLPYYLESETIPEHVIISQFLYSPLGEMMLSYAGTILKTESNLNGFNAIRAALVLASADSEGLTPINVLRHFPTRDVKIDLGQILEAIEGLREIGDFRITEKT